MDNLQNQTAWAPTNQETYQKNTKEQYEMLGRFVEAFENMVDEVRQVTLTISGVDLRNFGLIETILHHSAFSAKPLYEVFRAIVAEIMKDAFEHQEKRDKGIVDYELPLLCDKNSNPIRVTIRDRDIIFGVIAAIYSEYEALVNKRNDLLHGTWIVGDVTTDDPDSSTFKIRKWKPKKGGLSHAEGLPTNASELKTLVDRCKEVKDWIARTEDCLTGRLKITATFQFSEQRWWLCDPPGTRRPLL